MKLWKKASGALKDHKSLLKASFTFGSPLRNPDVETAVIKATTHDESRVDYRNAQRVFAWVAVSDECLQQVLWALSHRMWRTRNWVVVLKGLMLLHGVFCCKVPGIQQIGRLPFNLLNFTDKRTKRGKKLLDLNVFIRAYFTFLDEKSSFIFFHSQEQRDRKVKYRMALMSREESGTGEEPKEYSTINDLIWLQKLQELLELLLRVKPKSSQLVNMLVLEAMDCVVIEMYDICSRICNGVASILVRIYSIDKKEAELALSILQKAKVQHEQLSLYFEFCKDIGVGNASECPKMEELPEEGIQQLELIINGGSEQSPKVEEKSIILIEHNKLTKTHDYDYSRSNLKTIVTDDWEVFNEDKKKVNQDVELIELFSPPRKNNAIIVRNNTVELPDLISF